MPNASSPTIPKYRLHKPSGLGLVRIKGRNFYLGKYGTPESRREYERIIAEWLDAKGRVPPTRSRTAGQSDMTVNELFFAYWEHVKVYYVKNGQPTGEQSNVRDACRHLCRLYGETSVQEFGPCSLKAVRRRMVEDKLCRNVINARTHRIRRMFRWGVENELVDPAVLHALQAVPALKLGRSEARESEGVRPVPEAHVDAVLALASQQIGAMIRLQLLTGMRPGEVTTMRGCDLDTTGRVWVYRPASHKTEHHSHERLIYIGPKAQEVLRPFLKTDLQAYLFSPAEADAGRREALHAARKTPMSCGNRPGSNRRIHPKRKPGDHYTTNTYREAVRRACEQAFPPPAPLAQGEEETLSQWKQRLTGKAREELREWRRSHSWHPHQLRHNAATRLRKEFGIEAARVVLGHRSAGVTEIYAEIDHLRAADVMARVG